MSVPTTHGSGLNWPEEFKDILAALRENWGAGDEIYLSRLLGNGRSGALVYVVDVSSPDFTGQAILKLDHVLDPDAQEELEAALHAEAINDAPDFAKAHLPRLIQSLHDDSELAILSTIAGRALEYADPWHDLPYDRQLDVIRRVSRALLEDWNHDYTLTPGLVMPQDLLKGWLDYRIDPSKGGRIHAFMQDACGIPPETPSIFVDGQWYPNPLAFYDGAVEIPERLQLRAAVGHQHGDFHGFNLLVGQEGQQAAPQALEYYLIDLALYQGQQFLLYDHAYFEFTTLLGNRGDVSGKDWEAVIAQIRRYRHDAEFGLRSDDLGLIEIIQTARQGVSNWITAHEADRLAYMENQELLARVAVGLNFAHKNVAEDIRKKALYYAASNLKDYLRFNRVEWPKHGLELAMEAGAMPVSVIPNAGHKDVDAPQSGETPASGVSGVVDEPPATQGEKAPKRERRLWVALAAAVVLAVIGFGVLGLREMPKLMSGSGTSTATEALAVAPSERISLAVMPFSNLNQFIEDTFTDGLTIEIINVLASTGHFRIPGFSSVSKFRSSLDDPELIGRQLGTDYVVEGTVSQSNDRVRITVTLSNANTGDLVWNGFFEEDQENVFQAQEDLAKAIGEALSVPLDIDSEELAANRTLDPEAYESYVRGIALLEQRGPALARSISTLERAVEIQPDFAAAWAALSIAYNIAPTYLNTVRGQEVRPEVYYRQSQDAALTALDLDPESSDVQHAAANMYQRSRQWVPAERAYKRALELNPSNHRVMQDYAGFLTTAGKLEDAQALLDKAVAIDPINDLYRMMQARLEMLLTNSEESLATLEDIFVTAPAFREIAFRPILARRISKGQIDLAKQMLESCLTCTERFRTRALALIDSAGVLDTAEVYDAYRDDPFMAYMFLYKYSGLDLLFDAFEYNGLQSYYRLQYFTVPWGMLGLVADDPRFQSTIEDMGLDDYWRANGWPPMCEPTEISFECTKPENASDETE